MGHNLGMEHDFYTSKSACKSVDDGRFVWCNQCSNWDVHGNMLVTQVGDANECCTGFMDYGNHPEYWSNCSVRNFEQHYVSENWSECMPEGDILYFLYVFLEVGYYIEVYMNKKYIFHDITLYTII